jgi:putative DNA methylase
MSEGSQYHQSALRATLYALMELEKDVDGGDVLTHLTLNVPNYYSDQNQRDLVVEFAGFLAKKLETMRPEEASSARVLRDLVRNQRLA